MHAQPAHVLMIEDNPADAVLACEELRDAAGTEVAIEVRDTLEQGLAYIDSHSVDAVFLDLSLPDSHGIKTVERICEHAPELPVVVLSGNEQTDVAMNAIRAGAHDFVIKGESNGMSLLRSLLLAWERAQHGLEAEQHDHALTTHQFAGGMSRALAHMTTRITAELSRLEAVRRRDPDAMACLNRIGNEVLRAMDMSGQLAAIARCATDDADTCSADVVFHAHVDEYEKELPFGTYLQHHFDTDLWPVPASGGDLHDAVLSLVRNAADAMTNLDGFVTLKGFNRSISLGEIIEAHEQSGDFVVISVSDIGPGISPAAFPYVTEPFFTTRDDSGHAGLGLSVAQSLVRRCGGFLRILSDETYGTTVELFLPRTEVDIAATAALATTAPTVICVGLDDSIAGKLTTFLTAIGQAALYVNGANAALELIRRHDSIDSILVCSSPVDIADQLLPIAVQNIRPGVDVRFIDQQHLGDTHHETRLSWLDDDPTNTETIVRRRLLN